MALNAQQTSAQRTIDNLNNLPDNIKQMPWYATAMKKAQGELGPQQTAESPTQAQQTAMPPPPSAAPAQQAPNQYQQRADELAKKRQEGLAKMQQQQASVAPGSQENLLQSQAADLQAKQETQQNWLDQQKPVVPPPPEGGALSDGAQMSPPPVPASRQFVDYGAIAKEKQAEQQSQFDQDLASRTQEYTQQASKNLSELEAEREKRAAINEPLAAQRGIQYQQDMQDNQQAELDKQRKLQEQQASQKAASEAIKQQSEQRDADLRRRQDEERARMERDRQAEKESEKALEEVQAPPPPPPPSAPPQQAPQQQGQQTDLQRRMQEREQSRQDSIALQEAQAGGPEKVAEVRRSIEQRKEQARLDAMSPEQQQQQTDLEAQNAATMAEREAASQKRYYDDPESARQAEADKEAAFNQDLDARREGYAADAEQSRQDLEVQREQQAADYAEGREGVARFEEQRLAEQQRQQEADAARSQKSGVAAPVPPPPGPSPEQQAEWDERDRLAGERSSATRERTPEEQAQQDRMMGIAKEREAERQDFLALQEASVEGPEKEAEVRREINERKEQERLDARTPEEVQQDEEQAELSARNRERNQAEARERRERIEDSQRGREEEIAQNRADREAAQAEERARYDDHLAMLREGGERQEAERAANEPIPPPPGELSEWDRRLQEQRDAVGSDYRDRYEAEVAERDRREADDLAQQEEDDRQAQADLDERTRLWEEETGRTRDANTAAAARGEENAADLAAYNEQIAGDAEGRMRSFEEERAALREEQGLAAEEERVQQQEYDDRIASESAQRDEELRSQQDQYTADYHDRVASEQAEVDQQEADAEYWRERNSSATARDPSQDPAILEEQRLADERARIGREAEERNSQVNLPGNAPIDPPPGSGAVQAGGGMSISGLSGFGSPEDQQQAQNTVNEQRYGKVPKSYQDRPEDWYALQDYLKNPTLGNLPAGSGSYGHTPGGGVVDVNQAAEDFASSRSANVPGGHGSPGAPGSGRPGGGTSKLGADSVVSGSLRTTSRDPHTLGPAEPRDPHTLGPPGGGPAEPDEDTKNRLSDRFREVSPPEDRPPQPIEDEAPPPPPPDRDTDWEDQWGNVWDQHKESREGIMEQSYADQASAERRAANMNARMGAGMGGGFGAGMAQASLGGAQQRMQAQQEWSKRGVELRMAYLDRKLRAAEAAEDRELQREIQDKMNEANMQMTEIEARLGASPEALEAFDDREQEAKDRAEAEELGIPYEEYAEDKKIERQREADERAAKILGISYDDYVEGKDRGNPDALSDTDRKIKETLDYFRDMGFNLTEKEKEDKLRQVLSDLGLEIDPGEK